jgi:hypothetical protein
LAQARFSRLQVLLGLLHGELALLALQAQALLRLLDAGVRRLEVCTRLVVDRERIGGVNPRQQLTYLHRVAYIDENLAHNPARFGLHIDDIVGAQHARCRNRAHDIFAGDLSGAEFDLRFGGFGVASAHPERNCHNRHDAHNDCNAPIHSCRVGYPLFGVGASRRLDAGASRLFGWGRSLNRNAHARRCRRFSSGWNWRSGILWL